MVIVTYWLLIGALYTIGTFLVETYMHTQDPNVIFRLQQLTKNNETQSTIKTTMFMVAAWPLMLPFTIRAAYLKLSLAQYFLQLEEKKLVARRQKEQNPKPSPRTKPVWKKSSGNAEMQCAAMLQDHQLTHITLMLKESGKIGIWRVPFGELDTEKVIAFLVENATTPDIVTHNEEDSRRICETDESWLEVCVPGREKERATKWASKPTPQVPQE